MNLEWTTVHNLNILGIAIWETLASERQQNGDAGCVRQVLGAELLVASEEMGSI